ncbi:hypothetical protein XENTR_v10001549 [Xenopus tropicalis]|uniref:Proteinase-activated receptor 4 n=1 Tax=Xenopus tropicalis TaxID=8364 RepID=F6WHY7_XENTR|nr:proteinase-activated receptor 4 [Xenopus tropicalis]KAE8632439.1 hypothetical protein XENTR_v10001549 [Xenopus tropicalis]|eukprot:XP_002934417.1 PREDICTED: proteinase-activated receptor 4 [Xenopus tropicalis]
MGSLWRLCAFSAPLFLVMLWGDSLATTDYDDYSTDEPTNDTELQDFKLCPRSFPGEIISKNNRTYLCISPSSIDHLKSPITVLVIPSIYTLVFLVGLPANVVALWVLATRVKKMTSTVFLINLAVADLLLIVTLPFKISYYFLGNDWIFGETLCRVVTSFFYANIYCSVLLLMSISVDRYMAVVHPFFSRTFRSKNFAIFMCTISWMIAALSILPLAAMRQSYPLSTTDLTLCHDGLPRNEQVTYLFYYFLCLVVLGFLLPLSIIIFCYVSVIRVLMRNEGKYGYALKLIALVLVIVIVLLTPSNVVLLIHYSERFLHTYGDLYSVYMVCLAISSLNSCVDPFVYYYVSDEFREKVRQQFRKRSKLSITSLKTSKEVLPATTTTSHSRSVL